MKRTLHIVFRDLAPMPSLEQDIRRRVEKLDHWVPDLMTCHVTVQAESNRHRQGQAFRVQVTARLPDEEIVAGEHQVDEDPRIAMQGSFDALDRQLEDRARRRRGQVKHHEP